MYAGYAPLSAYSPSFREWYAYRSRCSQPCSSRRPWSLPLPLNCHSPSHFVSSMPLDAAQMIARPSHVANHRRLSRQVFNYRPLLSVSLCFGILSSGMVILHSKYPEASIMMRRTSEDDMYPHRPGNQMNPICKHPARPKGITRISAIFHCTLYITVTGERSSTALFLPNDLFETEVAYPCAPSWAVYQGTAHSSGQEQEH